MRTAALSRPRPRLVVVPLDPIASYERSGHGDYLEAYFNPGGMFGDVFAVSPLERGQRHAFGMTVIGVAEQEFASAVRAIRPDVIRAYGGWWCSDLVCRQRVSGIPVVVSVHDSLPARVSPSVRYADLVICVSEAVRRQVLAVGASPHRTRLLPNRIDRSVFRPVRDAAALNPVASRFPPGRYVLHIGRKDRQKNIDTVVRALTRLPSTYHAVFVGMGDRGPYVDLSRQLNVDGRCFWIDAISNSELPLWYSWCDCMCVPSRWEGFGYVFIEAAACGAAVVTSNIAPMNEYLSDGVSASLVSDYEDPAAVAAAIRRVCEDEDYRRTIAAGAQRAAVPFDRSTVDTAEMAIYREAMALTDLPLARRFEIGRWKARQAVVDATRSSVEPLRRSLAYLRSMVVSHHGVPPAGV